MTVAAQVRQLKEQIAAAGRVGQAETAEVEAKRKAEVDARLRQKRYRHMTPADIEQEVAREIPLPNMAILTTKARQGVRQAAQRARYEVQAFSDNLHTLPRPAAFLTAREANRYGSDVTLLTELRKLNQRAELAERREELAKVPKAALLKQFRDVVAQLRVVRETWSPVSAKDWEAHPGLHDIDGFERQQAERHRLETDAYVMQRLLTESVPFTPPANLSGKEQAAAQMRAEREHKDLQRDVWTIVDTLVSPADRRAEADAQRELADLEAGFNSAILALKVVEEARRPIAEPDAA